MSILKKLGKSILVAGIVMLFAAPVMAGKGAGPGDGTGNNPICHCYDYCGQEQCICE